MKSDDKSFFNEFESRDSAHDTTVLQMGLPAAAQQSDNAGDQQQFEGLFRKRTNYLEHQESVRGRNRNNMPLVREEASEEILSSSNNKKKQSFFSSDIEARAKGGMSAFP